MCNESVRLKIFFMFVNQLQYLHLVSTVGMLLKLNETKISTKHNMLKNPNGLEDYYSAIYKMAGKLN